MTASWNLAITVLVALILLLGLLGICAALSNPKGDR